MRRTPLFVLVVISALTLFWQGSRLALDPNVHWLEVRTLDEVRSLLAAELAFRMTPKSLEDALSQALAESPADWQVVDGLLEYAAEHNIAVSQSQWAEIAERRRQERDWIAIGKACAQCAWDSRTCEPRLAMGCNLMIEMTPLGDMRSLLSAARDFWDGTPIDYTDLGLTAVGLAGTAAVVVSGGTSYVAKIGSGLLKAARKSGSMSGRFQLQLRRMTQGVVDFRRLPENWWQSPSSLMNVLDRPRLSALGNLTLNLGQIVRRQGRRQALNVLESTDYLYQLAIFRQASEAMGDRFPMTMHLLGPSKVVSVASRWSGAAWVAAAASMTLLVSLVVLFWSMLGRAEQEMTPADSPESSEQGSA